MLAELGSPVAQMARVLIPTDFRSYLGHRYCRREFHRYVAREFPNGYLPVAPGPMAPPELIMTEALMKKGDLANRTRADWYFGSGYRDALRVLVALEENGFDMGRLDAVMEFGCGSSRVLRHLRNLQGVKLTGTDANPNPVLWGRQNLPGIEYRNNSLEPPLDVPAASYDAIYALSVFTHIPMVWQHAWLEELHRVLRPGGFLLCTIMSDAYFDEMLNPDLRRHLLEEGALTLDGDNSHSSYSTQVLDSWEVFQTRDDVRRRFSKVFEILDYSSEPLGQNMLVLRKS